MFDHKRPNRHNRHVQRQRAGGQALVEYALIVVLVVIAIIGILALTGPAVGNIFSNTVYNLLNATLEPYDTLSPAKLSELMTFVAQYTPVTRIPVSGNNTGGNNTGGNNTGGNNTGGNNTGGNNTGGGCGAVTCTPTNTPSVTNTPTVTYTPTITPNVTATDREFAVNSSDLINVANVSQWHYAFINPGALWTVNYFNNTTCSGAPALVETKPDVAFDAGTGSPGTGVGADNYCITWNLANFVVTGQRWEVRVTGTNTASASVGGTTYAQYSSGSLESSGVGSFVGPNVATTINVRYVKNSAGSAARMRFTISRLTDKNTCSWTIQSGQRKTDFYAWSDSEPGAYAVNSQCTLRKRGWYELVKVSTNLPRRPVLIFWERWKLNTGDTLQVGVRDYDTPSMDWLWQDVHTYSASYANFNWNRQMVFLDNFGGTNFTDKRVEIAFRMVSDAANTEDGWYIDDISVANWNPNAIEPDYSDPIDSTTSARWVPECQWGLANDAVRGMIWQSKGATAGYSNGDFCPLNLVDLVKVPSPVTDKPLLVFDSKVKLASTTDQVRIEYALKATPNNWQSLLTAIGQPTPYIAQGVTDRNWETLKYDLSALAGQEFRLRFVVNADIDGSTAEGWFIDRFIIKLNKVNLADLPYYDDFTAAVNWELGGSWGLTAGADPSRPAPGALTDSPNGTTYQPNSTTYTVLNAAWNLQSATNPVMHFYTRWESPTATLNVDISLDDGLTWPTTIWSFNPATLGTRNNAWERIEIDLLPYRPNPRVMFRFRLVTTGSATVGDGWYIDDFRLEEKNTDVLVLNTQLNRTYKNGFDNVADTNKWYNGGNWTAVAGQGRASSPAFIASPSGPYANYIRSIVEFIPTIDLTGLPATNSPAVVFWLKNELNTAHEYAVEVKGSGTGGNWQEIWSTQSDVPVNLGWHRMIVPLNASYGTSLRLRFVLLAMDGNPTASGVSLEDVEITDREVWPDQMSSFPERFDSGSGWLFEGDWNVASSQPSDLLWSAPETLPVTMVPQLANGSTQWVGDWWHTNSGTIWTGGTQINRANVLLQTPTQGNIPRDTLTYNFGADTTNLPFPTNPAWNVGALLNHEWYIARWRRTFTSLQGAGLTDYLLRLEVTGGAQVIAGGTAIEPTTTLPRPYVSTASTPSTGTNTRRVFYYQIPISGATVIEIWYHFSTVATLGNGYIDAKFLEQNPMARSSVLGQDYADKFRTSLTLNGFILIPAGKTATVVYDERWSVAATDNVKPYYSTNLGGTWTAVTAARHDENSLDANGLSLQEWTSTSFNIPNAGASPIKVMLRWELESLINTAVGDGWMIDNIQVIIP